MAKVTSTRTKAVGARDARARTSGANPKGRQAPSVSTGKPGAEAKKPRVFSMAFASVYPLYVQKAEKKGRTKREVDQVIAWLTGYEGASLERVIAEKVDLEGFFANAPRLSPEAALIRGVVCGVRVEDVADPLMQKIRYLDKLVDELAQGKAMTSILRTR
jgi:hypothetical protein